jgi:hypothetical protein
MRELNAAEDLRLSETAILLKKPAAELFLNPSIFYERYGFYCFLSSSLSDS